MEQFGSLTVRVTTSQAQLPVSGASVIVTTSAGGIGNAVQAVLETNESGVAGPIRLSAPTTPTDGTSPGGPVPYALYSLWVEHPGYEVVLFRDFQVFPNVQTVQSVSLIPLSGNQMMNGSGGVNGSASQTL